MSKSRATAVTFGDESLHALLHEGIGQRLELSLQLHHGVVRRMRHALTSGGQGGQRADLPIKAQRLQKRRRTSRPRNSDPCGVAQGRQKGAWPCERVGGTAPLRRRSSKRAEKPRLIARQPEEFRAILDFRRHAPDA